MSRDSLEVEKRSQMRHFVPVDRIDEFWGTNRCDIFEGLLEAKQILSWSVEKIKPGALYVLFDPQKCCRIVITVGAGRYTSGFCSVTPNRSEIFGITDNCMPRSMSHFRQLQDQG
jgi:hypothetical protein